MHLEFKIEDCLSYNIEHSVDTPRLKAAMESGQTLKVKLGIDPTSPNVHLGRAIALWRLRAFQELGHEIHLIIGDFTAQVGDTSDKESERPMLTVEQIAANLQDYETQLWRVLNPDRKDQVHFHHNSEWLAPLSFGELYKLADAFSVNTFIKRELIANRLTAGGRVSLREMLYPLMQGYDSVVLKPDVEIGGSDQWFNMLAGRTLMEQQGITPQAILAHRIVAAADGEKMSSSRGNVITLNQDAFGLFTQMMQIPDQDLVPSLDFYPQPGRPFSQEELEGQLQAGQNPRDLKLIMAKQMTELLYGQAEAEQARSRWDEEATHGQIPHDNQVYVLLEESIPLLKLLVSSRQIQSNSEARRLLQQGAIQVDGEVVKDEKFLIKFGQIVKTGKHRYLEVTDQID